MLMGHSTSQPPPPRETCSQDHSEERAGLSESLHEVGGMAPGLQLWTGPSLPTPSLRLFTLPTTLELSFRKTVSTQRFLSFALPLLLSGFKWYVLVFGAIHIGSSQHTVPFSTQKRPWLCGPAHRPSHRHDYLIHSLLYNR